MRIYVPAIFSDLQKLAQDGEMPLRSSTAFALTPAVRDYFISDDEEELSYVAYIDAARASLRLLAIGDEERFPNRRVVLTFDIDDSRIAYDPAMGEATVKVDPPTLERKELASIHIDLEHAEQATEAAKRIIDDADLGDDDAEHLLGDCEDNDLAWYDPSELAFIVELS